MRSLRLPLSGLRPGLAVRHLLLRSLEAALWAAVLAALELGGRALPGSDTVALALIVLVGVPAALLAAALARRGWLPGTCAVARRVREGAQRWLTRLTPRYELAFRMDRSATVRRDRPFVGSLLLLGVLLAAAVVFGGRFMTALDALRAHVSVTLHLLTLCLLWLSLLAVLTAAFVLQVQLVGLPLTLFIASLGLVAAALMPAYVFTFAVLALGLAQSVRMARRPLAEYLFCRRDRRGHVRVARAQTVLRRIHLLCTLALALVATLGNAERLGEPGLAHGTYAFTGCLGMLAALPALLLMGRLDLHFGRLLCARSEPPETPLVPTLWWDGPLPVPPHVAEARRAGWEVIEGGAPRPEDVDLVAGPSAAGPRRVLLSPDVGTSERVFSLQRRFHVVYRREFVRRFEGLVKQARASGERRGTGFLFSPHTWLVPSLLRDTGRSATPVGPPFQLAFSARLRRYLGGLLRALQLDVVYWEDAVRWRDLRRVLGVLFECFDQGRLPLRERHFVGLPGLRVLLQEEDGPGASDRDRRLGMPQAPVGSGARVLVILRDRGGEPEREKDASPSDRRPVPLSL